MRSMNELKMLQALPLEVKIEKSKLRIMEWIRCWGWNHVCVSFSGGLDSSVLLHLVRSIDYRIKVASIKSIECKENQDIINNTANLDVIKPSKSHIQVIKDHGYPIISKDVSKSLRRFQNPTKANEKSRKLALTGITSNGVVANHYKFPKKWEYLIDSDIRFSEQCCYYMKKKPLSEYAKKNDMHYFTGLKASDSIVRASSWIQRGCNSFTKTGTSSPLSFWNEQDILKYILQNHITISKAYGDIVNVNGELKTTKADRTGCFICGFGVHMEKSPNRFQRMKQNDPKLYEFAINELGYGKVLDLINVKYD